MVKIIIKAAGLATPTIKRMRGVKSKMKPNNPTKKMKFIAKKIQPKPFNVNYYLQPKIDFLFSQEGDNLTKLMNIENSEFSEIKPDRIQKYKQEHRALAIIGLKDIIFQVIDLSQGKINLSEKFIFTVISLYEYFLIKLEKDLSKTEIIKSLFSCLVLIDQVENIQIFTTSFFRKSTNPNFEVDLNILNVVDLNLFPVKVYDYFEIFFLRISQEKKDDKNYQKYIKLFKDVFIEFNFYFSFHENSKIKKPSINFISCLIMTYAFIKSNFSLKYENVKAYINHYKNIMKYDDQEYLFAREIIKESKYVYDDLVKNLKVNKKCKEGLLNNVNINCI